jgi:hypothetical protein
MPISAESLQRVGIQLRPDEFEDLLLEVIALMRASWSAPDKRPDLPRADAEALTRGGFDLDPVDRGRDDPLARTAAEYTALLATGLTVDEAATRLNIDAKQVRQRLKTRALYGIRLHEFYNGWRLPAFQFDHGGVLPGIDKVIRHLDPGLHPVAVARWFVTPNVDLLSDDQAVSPRDWLRSGHSVDHIADLAVAL